MRFIFYFVFFGLLFYIISMYFPEAFQTLVSWAATVFNFIHDLVVTIVDKINAWTGKPVHPAQPIPNEVPKQIVELFRFL